MVGLTLGEVAHKTLPLMGADQTLQKAAEVMLASNVLGVVTADVKRRPVLVLTYRTLLKALAKGAHLKSRISEYAIDEPIVAREEISVIEGLELMRRNAVRFLPVVDARNRIVGVFEPRHAVQALWDLLDYGEVTIQARLRKLIALPADTGLREAAIAMDRNGVPEVLVRVGEELKILREQDFLRAVKDGAIDEAKVADYARGKVIMVPQGFDAKSAVDLMIENDINRLVVEMPERGYTVITLTDLAFEAGERLATKRPLETGFILVKTETGKELELANKIILEEGVTEVYTVTGEYDLLVRVDAPSLREIYEIVREKIRRLPGVLETRTMVGVRAAAKG